MAQDRVPDRLLEPFIELLLEPLRAVRAADLPIDDGDGIVTDNECAVGQAAITVDALGELLDLERRQLRPREIEASANQYNADRGSGQAGGVRHRNPRALRAVLCFALIIA